MVFIAIWSQRQGRLAEVQYQSGMADAIALKISIIYIQSIDLIATLRCAK